MKAVKFLGLLIVSVFVLSCGSLKAPEYVGVKDLSISSVVNDSVTVNAKLDFKNPNRVGGTMILKNLQTKVNGYNVGDLEAQEVEVPSKETFSVPLKMKLSSSKLFDTKEGVLSSLLASLFTNKVEINLKGEATFKKLFFTKTYPIDFTKKIKIQE